MLSILSLPSECIYDIGRQLDDKDNMALRLVCRYISYAVEELVLSKLFIDLNLHTFEKTRQQLLSIANQPERLARYVRTVHIYNSRSEREAYVECEEKEAFAPTFLAAMGALQSIRKVSWETRACDEEAITAVVFSYINNTHIRELSFNSYGGCPSGLPAQLSTMKNLESFIFTNMFYTGYHSRHIFAALSTVISQSPGLNYLEFDSGFYLANDGAPSLHAILPNDPDSPPLLLKSLSLRCMRILLDFTTLYHLQALESLSIHFNLTTPTLGSHLSQIWDTLRAESVHLKKIDVNLTQVDDALLDYITSYDGIQQIIFGNSARLWCDEKTTDKIANRFFKDVLPKVSCSLRVLHLETTVPGEWCFGKHNAASIAQCKGLRDLTVSVVDIIQTYSRDSLILLDQLLSVLPNLQRLAKKNVASVPQIG